MNLKTAYTLIAPVYDVAIDRATRAARQQSLAHLPASPGRILVNGVGTGLDLPLLPPQHHYVGLDLTAAMLARARPRACSLDFQAVRGDAQRLPFADAAFDHAVLHLILAVVPNPNACLAEIARVVKPGGTVLVFDKFLKRGQPVRRCAGSPIHWCAVSRHVSMWYSRMCSANPPAFRWSTTRRCSRAAGSA